LVPVNPDLKVLLIARSNEFWKGLDAPFKLNERLMIFEKGSKVSCFGPKLAIECLLQIVRVEQVEQDASAYGEHGKSAKQSGR
jgi:hypothetical protein